MHLGREKEARDLYSEGADYFERENPTDPRIRALSEEIGPLFAVPDDK